MVERAGRATNLRNGDLVLADRGYARTPGLLHVREMGADFIMRIGWSTIRLLTPNGTRLDWNALYAGMQPGQIAEHEVLVDHSGRKLGISILLLTEQPPHGQSLDTIASYRARPVLTI
ncbi:MAG: hypothetical protein JOZ94_15260 [Xanthobacteraceae bacterium]|nr:hypothetical protein [Xanthobacteraceae bacterium]